VGATGNNFNFAADIGNNPTTETVGAPDGAYAGGGSLIGSTDSATSSNNTAIDIGNNGLNPNLADQDGGNSGAFAGDGHLIGLSGAGNGDTAYTFGNINGANDGSAAVDGNSNSAYTNGTEIGQNEGAFAGLGNNNSATADVNYTHDGDGASAIAGNNNYAFVNGPDNSTADAGGTSTAIGDPATNLGNNDIAYVSDPFGAAGSPDGAVAGGGFSNDLAEVLFAHGNASADTANLLYDIVSLFGNFSGSL
jgi:hypothetical protein